MNYYIHIPFCRNKCGYCAFYSVTGCSDSLCDAFLDKLEIDLAQITTPADTIYIGGGTPTLLSLKQLERVFKLIEKIPRNAGCEISIESNPETLDADKVSLISEHVSRISLGIQSFNANLRQTLGRQSSDISINNSIELIHNSGFKHFNCDLIYGIPGSTLGQWQNDLESAIAAGVDHVSCYNLTPEEQSLLGNSFIIDNDAALEMYHIAEETLSGYGIKRYEISNYAKSGAECQHNINIWKGGKLTAFGPSAAGFDGKNRYSNVEDLDRWLAGAEPECDIISDESRCREIFAVNLRTIRGWQKNMWSPFEKTVSWQEMTTFFNSAMETVPEHFYIIENDNVRLSGYGLLYWNDIAERIIT